jgi:deazaflavin-dependent oxidoreductase (nitroreductase family)
VGYLDVADRTWPLLRRLMAGHTLVYRATGGVIGHRFPGSPATLLLEHTGARSGKQRTTPLLYARDGQNVIVVASKGGYPKHPAWFHNLMANPDTTVQIGARRHPVHARTATAAERGHLWPLVVSEYGGYEAYQARAGREIPLVVLEPR